MVPISTLSTALSEAAAQPSLPPHNHSPIADLLLTPSFGHGAVRAVYAYRHPDLDGLASAVGLSEISSHFSEWPLHPRMVGTPQREALWAFEYLNVELPMIQENFVGDVVLVDTPFPEEVGPWLTREQIIGLMDHHADYDPILKRTCYHHHETVGANATLVWELAQQLDCPLSRKSASLLFLAIMSNTAALRSSDTTTRDCAAAQSLRLESGITDSVVAEMFHAKSTFDGQSLLEVLLPDVCPADYVIADRRCVFAQLEICGVEQLLSARGSELAAAIVEITTARGGEVGVLSMIELGRSPSEQGATYFLLTENDPTAKFLLELEDMFLTDDGFLVTPRILTRKHAIRLLRHNLAIV